METNAKYTLENRRYVIIGAVVLLVIVFIIRLFYLQVVENDYKAWADSNAFLKKTLLPSRGMIYDRNGKLLVYNQPAYEVMLIMRVKFLTSATLVNKGGLCPPLEGKEC